MHQDSILEPSGGWLKGLGEGTIWQPAGQLPFPSPLSGLRLRRGAAAESCTPAWAAEARTWISIWIPPWNHARARGVAAAPSMVPNHKPPSLIGDPTSSRWGALRGAWRGRTRALGSGGLEEMSISLPPQRGPPYQCLPASHTKAPHLPARAGSKRRRTSRLAGGCERASVRVCVCPCLCVTGAVRSSVRLRVRGRPSVGLSAEPSVPLSLLVPCPIAPPNAPGLQSRGYSCRVCWAPPARAPPRPRTGLRRSPGIAQGSPARRGGGGELRHRLGL